MPEYLAPGVYIEETSYRAKSIEGVATSTCGFVGQAGFGPTRGKPLLITSYEEYRRRFGEWDDLVLQGMPQTNWLAHAIQAFFQNGGKRVYVSRIFQTVPNDDTDSEDNYRAAAPGTTVTVAWVAGTATVQARFPGSTGNMRVQVSATRGRNRLVSSGGVNRLVGLKEGEIVQLYQGAPVTAPLPTIDARSDIGADATNLRVVDIDDQGVIHIYGFDGAGARVDVDLSGLPAGSEVRPLGLGFKFTRSGFEQAYAGLSTHPDARSYMARVLREEDPYDEAARAFVGVNDDYVAMHCLEMFWSLLPANAADVVRLEGGEDGFEPTSGTWLGEADADGNGANATGIEVLGEIDDIAIVAAPGSSELSVDTERQAVRNHLITHCENLQYRFAILAEGPFNLSIQGIRDVRAQHDSEYAALYYPYVVVPDPFGQRGDVLNLPPEGFMAGIYARSDIDRGVHKAPANEVVRGALRFSRNINKGVQDVLNPEGINCLRYFEGRGYRVWGARTISSDPEWKYLNVRRLFIFLEHSIDKATQWAVFEPNNDELWLKIRLTIELFLIDVWRTGALMGKTPEDAFFVRCDRTTMTQGDLDNGRLVCLIGVAPTKPAEYVIFRIGQWTADASIV